MVRRLHYGNHNFGGYHSLCLNRCKVCNASTPSLPGTPLPTTCASCGSPLEGQYVPQVHFNRDAAAIPQDKRHTGTPAKECREQQAAVQRWKESRRKAREDATDAEARPAWGDNK